MLLNVSHTEFSDKEFPQCSPITIKLINSRSLLCKVVFMWEQEDRKSDILFWPTKFHVLFPCDMDSTYLTSETDK